MAQATAPSSTDAPPTSRRAARPRSGCSSSSGRSSRPSSRPASGSATGSSSSATASGSSRRLRRHGDPRRVQHAALRADEVSAARSPAALGLQVYPMLATVANSFTNYGVANSMSKEQATASIIANSVFEVEGAERYRLSIAVPEGSDPATGDLTFLLTDDAGVVRAGTIEGIEEISQDGIEKTTTGKVLTAPDTPSRRPPGQRPQRRASTSSPSRPRTAAAASRTSASPRPSRVSHRHLRRRRPTLTDTGPTRSTSRERPLVPQDARCGFATGWRRTSD